MKRVALYLLTNFAVLIVLGTVCSLLGVNRFLTENGLNLGMLLGFAAVFGFGGSLISLLISKQAAKFSMRVQVIEQPQNETQAWLLEVVRRQAEAAGIGMPEVGIYEGEPNAFATGARRDSALVAVSTGLLQGMTREEVEAVMGHEISHVANGDMVTLALLQGVMNTFVIFASRAIGFMIDSYFRRGSDGQRSGGFGPGYFITTIVLDIVFGILASFIVAWFSRQREFRADAGSARILGNKRPMIHALARLGNMRPGQLPQTIQAFGITGAIGKLMASHPPIEDRIAALEKAE